VNCSALSCVLWLERALRDKVEHVMSAQSGADWARASRHKNVIGWVKLYEKKHQSVWHPSFKPTRVVDASYFSELAEFALLSDDCSAQILVFDSVPEAEIRVEIGRVNDARNSLTHASGRIDDHAFGFVRGIIVKLASLAGLTPPHINPTSQAADDEW
jgi:hypothetical protein